MKNENTETTPVRSVLEELEKLQAQFQAALKSYGERMESDFQQIHATVVAESEKTKTSKARLRDMRDILTLLRNADVRVKGKRKELKKMDSLVGDLAMLVENW